MQQAGYKFLFFKIQYILRFSTKEGTYNIHICETGCFAHILNGLGGVTFPIKDQIHKLGVLLDSALSTEKQISAMARSAFLNLQQIAQFWPYLDRKSLMTLIHSLLISRINCCNALCVGLPLKDIAKLHHVQNMADRWIWEF